MLSYIANIKRIGEHVLLLYKNFFHWNISKICIFLYANVIGFIVSIPFVGIIIYQYFANYSTLGLSVNSEEFLLNNMGNIIITMLVIFCIVTIFLCTYTYGNFLLQNVYKSYLVGERLPYTKNLYFSGKYFRTYMGILGWMGLYLLIPIAVGLILIIPFGILVNMSFGLSTFIIGAISLVFFIALFVWFIYLAVRLMFSYYIFLYSENMGKSKIYIEESFRLTKKKVWRIIFLILPFLILFGAIGAIAQMGEEFITRNRVYDTLINIQLKSGQDDHKLLEEFFSGNDDDKRIFNEVERIYVPIKNSIDRNFFSASLPYMSVKSIDKNWWIITSISVLLSFLILDGLVSIVYLSTYSIIAEKDKKDVGAS